MPDVFSHTLPLSALPVSRLRTLPGADARVETCMVTPHAVTLLYRDGGRIHCVRERQSGLYPFSSEFLTLDRHVVTGWHDPMFVLGNAVAFEIVRAREYAHGGLLWLAEYRGRVS
jgi:hypothetical protein